MVSFGLLKVGTKVFKGENLFDRLDVEKEIEIISKENLKLLEKRKNQLVQQNSDKNTQEKITIDDFSKIELKVGKILECKEHPKADRLLVFKIDIGNEIRTIVSGIKKYYSKAVSYTHLTLPTILLV